MASDYILETELELERLERQADLQGLDRVRDHVTLADGDAALDAGSGSGWVSRLLAREHPGARVTGIDITPGFVAYAARRAGEAGLANLDYVVGDIADLPFETGRFDLVWSQYVVFFLPAPERAIAEFVRVARPGGRVTVAVTECPFQWITPERPALSQGIAALRDAGLHGWRTSRLPAMMCAAGLEDVSVEIAVDRVHSFIGGPSAGQRRNIEESYGRVLQAMPEAVGGTAAAERLLDDLTDFLDKGDSTAFCTHWTVSGRTPAA